MECKRKEWKAGYKVVRRQGNRYVSCIEGRDKGCGWKVYGIGHITRRTPGYIRGIKDRIASHGPLAVFQHRASAIRFMNTDRYDGRCEDAVICSCRFIESGDLQCWRPGYRIRQLCHGYVPDERFADEVVLIEELSP